MTRLVTKRDVAVRWPQSATIRDAFKYSFIVPAGTEVESVACGLGPQYAVKDAGFVARASGDSFAAAHHYCWIDAANVEEAL